MTHRLNRWLLLLAVLLGPAYWWLMIDTAPGNAKPQPVHIAQLRALAAALPGQKPAAIEVETLATRLSPGNLIAAGSGLKRRPLIAVAYRLPVPGGKPVVIDSGMDETQSARLGYRNFDSEAQQRVDTAMAAAGMILFTSERLEHMGGLAALSARTRSNQLVARARLSATQLDAAPAFGVRWPDAARPAADLPEGAPHAVAPGVVVIPAPGQTRGAQMIFVSLADGREFLFAGDTATIEANWKEQRGRARIVTWRHGHENREAVFGWLRTLAMLRREAPTLQVVPAHDFEWHWAATGKRQLLAGFRNGN